MEQGFFVTFEGLDGSGKSTQLRLLASALMARNLPVLTTRNPGGTPLGERVRGLLLDSRAEDALGGIAPAAEMALMFADRAQSLQQLILPALGRGEIVLCDRFTDSTEAYQGAGRQLGPERVLVMHRAVCGDVEPDLTVLLLPPLQTSLARARRRNERQIQLRGTDENRFEREDDAFYGRIYAQYERIATRSPERVLTLREEGPIERIAATILSTVSQRLPQPSARQ